MVKTLIESFQYPRKGPGMMWEAAARKIKKRGGKVLMGRELQKLCLRSRQASSGASRFRPPTAARENYTARHVICSAPVRELMEKISPRADLAVCMRAQLRYRDFLTVALMVKKPDLFPDNWIYIHDPSVKVGRVQNFRSWSPEMVPAGHELPRARIFLLRGRRPVERRPTPT